MTNDGYLVQIPNRQQAKAGAGQNAMEKLAGALERVNFVIGNTLCWAALGMLLLQFVIVLLRYVFGYSFIFLDEGVLYFHAAIFMLGAGYTFLVNAHVRVDIFYAKCTERTKAKIDLFGHLFLLTPALLVLLWFSWPSVRGSWAILEGPISVGGIPASFLLKSLIPAYCVLLLIQGLAAFIRDILRLKGTPA
jgi:TRAP-type mannitol/chloroaromatic compound transport system permease small subunit